ncbi:MAG: TetR/AcrR family transcriptional regulator [Gloeomargarita sp. SKYBB_i_bin120]|nr:TetR/AcrR family transcriptional regulator [Gloeomargarita sp. SKYG98]MCS7292423.1 TetR/AcrR family transcriptional regulator [Gloeomargarita sp. SKYB120]MDW8177984.1 TetR/AcrR family transcriptional regulator [Gloeomargarita sp. SKYBB_i_bin120]
MAYIKRTREDILRSIVDVVHQHGFRATGLKELLAVSQTSAGSIYNYFGNKDELGHALIDYQWKNIRDKVIWPAIASCDEPIAQLLAVIDAIEQRHLHEPNCAGCLLGNLIVDLAGSDDAFRKHLITVFDEWQGIFTRLLEQGKQQLRPEIVPEQLAEQILTYMEGTLLMSRLYDQGDERHHLRRGFSYIRQLLKDACIKH